MEGKLLKETPERAMEGCWVRREVPAMPMPDQCQAFTWPCNPDLPAPHARP